MPNDLEPKNTRIGVRVSPKELGFIRAFAKSQSLVLSEAVRVAVRFSARYADMFHNFCKNER